MKNVIARGIPYAFVISLFLLNTAGSTKQTSAPLPPTEQQLANSGDPIPWPSCVPGSPCPTKFVGGDPIPWPQCVPGSICKG